MALCPKCHGTGIHRCHRCGGSGTVAPDAAGAVPTPPPQHSPAAMTHANEPADADAGVRCPSCHGVGTETCRQCDGAGEV